MVSTGFGTDDLEWKALLKWMIWGEPYFRNHPIGASGILMGIPELRDRGAS